MKPVLLIGSLFLLPALLQGQDDHGLNDSLLFKGQASLWSLFNPANELPWYIGGRYIPEFSYGITTRQNQTFDLDVSVNMYGSGGFNFKDSSHFDGKIKPYRSWLRYSTTQFELRAGLQKINFGSASMLRPLMWFDQIDPNDPLKLTDGVWGLLSRYYFLNNANLWFWILYGNEKTKGLEVIKVNKKYPEIGGRIQVPIPLGEAALSYHYRIADSRDNEFGIPEYAIISENRTGIDARIDYVLGFWTEASWIHKGRELGLFTNQELVNVGADYTVGLGNGLYMVAEHLLAFSDEKVFAFKDPVNFTLLSLSYPLGLFDNISTAFYYDWTNQNIYAFLNWQKQFDKFVFYMIGFWNPEDYNLPIQGTGENLFAGQGIQVMLVFNH